MLANTTVLVVVLGGVAGLLTYRRNIEARVARALGALSRWEAHQAGRRGGARQVER